MAVMQTGTVLSQEEISPSIFDLKIEAPQAASSAVPGQFVDLYTDDPSRLLPRPVSICGADPEKGVLRLVYRVSGPGTGTEELSRRAAGSKIRLLGPLGNGFPLSEAGNGRVLLVGGGIGIPPLLYAAKKLREARKDAGSAAVILGYRNSDTYLSGEFAPYADVVIATEDGSVGTKGTVIDAIRANDLHADAIFACGPKPMLAALASWSEAENIPCWVSMEERMACGIGACLACVCRTKDVDDHSHVRNRRVCKDGPVFRADELVF